MARKNSKKNDAQIDTLVQNTVEQMVLEAPEFQVPPEMSEPDGSEIVWEEITQEYLDSLPKVSAVEEVLLDQVLDESEVHSVQAAQAPAPTDPEPLSFDQLMSEVPEDAITSTMNLMKTRIAERRQMEVEKDSYNDNIHRTLKNVEQTLVRPRAAQVLVAASVSPDFIIEGSRGGENYNVYAMGKLNDLVDALAGLKLSNKINVALVRTMFALRRNGRIVTRELLECAASDKIKVKDTTVLPFMTRHSVGASTAPTQTSSTLRALATLGIVKVTGRSASAVVEIIDTPQTAALEAVALAQAA